MSARCKPGKQQVGQRRQHRAQHQDAHHAVAQRQHAAERGTDQRHDHAVHARNRRHLVLGKAHIAIKRVRHHAEHDVRDAVSGDQCQQQRRVPAVPAREVEERTQHRRAQPADHALLARRQLDGLRLAREEHRDDTHPDQARHAQVRREPGPVLVGRLVRIEHRRNPQRPRGSSDHRRAIADLIRRRHRRLARHVGGLDAKGIEGNVLRRGGKSHQQCKADQARQILQRIGKRHARQTRHQHNLRRQQPAAPATQPAREQRQWQPIDQRRPRPLEGVGEPDPGKEADGGAVDAGFAQAE